MEPKHILLVEDDSAVMRTLVNALSEYRLTIACDGVEALSLLAGDETVDLIITDYLMPSMTGDELIGRARAKRPDLKVLMISGHYEILSRANLTWWTTERHLAKPFHIEELTSAVTQLLGAA